MKRKAIVNTRLFLFACRVLRIQDFYEESMYKFMSREPFGRIYIAFKIAGKNSLTLYL